jgi:hypothetical protein
LEKKTEVTLDGKEIKEEIEVAAKDLWETVKKLAHEVNVRRLIIKNKDGEPCLEIPITVASIAFILIPLASLIGGLVALATDFKIEVVKVVPEEKPAETPPEAPKE